MSIKTLLATSLSSFLRKEKEFIGEQALPNSLYVSVAGATVNNLLEKRPTFIAPIDGYVSLWCSGEFVVLHLSSSSGLDSIYWGRSTNGDTVAASVPVKKGTVVTYAACKATESAIGSVSIQVTKLAGGGKPFKTIVPQCIRRCFSWIRISSETLLNDQQAWPFQIKPVLVYPLIATLTGGQSLLLQVMGTSLSPLTIIQKALQKSSLEASRQARGSHQCGLLLKKTKCFVMQQEGLQEQRPSFLVDSSNHLVQGGLA